MVCYKMLGVLLYGCNFKKWSRDGNEVKDTVGIKDFFLCPLNYYCTCN